MAVSKDEILEAISNMSIMQIVELISDMENKFGVTAAAPVAAAAAPAAFAAAAGILTGGYHATHRTRSAAQTALVFFKKKKCACVCVCVCV